tara:strand:+ start:249 stop:1277 length:1029 start_codon:yes stop_codon:yes gene_type:complete
MNIEFTRAEKEQLDLRHRKERDRRVADRIKAVLLRSEGWTQKQIAQALRIRYETVQDHITDYIKFSKLKPENGGSKPQLSKEKEYELVKHIEEQTYLKATKICDYVQSHYGVTFTVSGMTQWLKRKGFSYKMPKGTPAKANPEQQALFIKIYEKLMTNTPEDEPIEFADAVHPTMATKITHGWIRKGKNKEIHTISSRTRINIVGSINLETMSVSISDHETVNSSSLIKHLKEIRRKYLKAPKIHLILDRGGYNRSQETRAAAKELGIELHFLPPYSPNLNPIERLWKVMNEYTRNNRVFQSAKDFREEILAFFNTTWPKIAHSMTDRINDNFQIINKVSLP